MTLEERVSWQRIAYIVESYQLSGDDGETFDAYLSNLMDRYLMPIVELAFAESIVDVWTSVPLPRGIAFLDHANKILQGWAENGVSSHLMPSDFQQITGLDPAPVLEALKAPTSTPQLR
ncbi:MAG: hypothetical protein H7237_03875 [Alkalinema sp. FL-bin-369]|nr:hypothetical protein [Leptolyngbyaceae cyanobacterium LF-bin-369]